MRQDAAHARAEAFPAAPQPSEVRSTVDCTAGALRGHGRRRDSPDLNKRTGSMDDTQRRRGN